MNLQNFLKTPLVATVTVRRIKACWFFLKKTIDLEWELDFVFCVSSLSLQDEEINQQSQLVEKLKQQMLDQEEVSERSCAHVKLA